MTLQKIFLIGFWWDIITVAMEIDSLIALEPNQPTPFDEMLSFNRISSFYRKDSFFASFTFALAMIAIMKNLLINPLQGSITISHAFTSARLLIVIVEKGEIISGLSAIIFQSNCMAPLCACAHVRGETNQHKNMKNNDCFKLKQKQKKRVLQVKNFIFLLVLKSLRFNVHLRRCFLLLMLCM